MKKILIIALSPVFSDPRVLRQISLLEEISDLTVAGFSDYSNSKIKFIKLPETVRAKGLKRFLNRLKTLFTLAFRMHSKYYWFTLQNKRILDNLTFESPFDFVIANDFDSAPIALAIQAKKYILDAHEFTPDENYFSIMKVLFSGYKNWLCENHIEAFDKVFTVSEGISEKYAREYNVPAPEILMNTPLYEPISPSLTSEESFRLVHHGVAVKGRGIEHIVELMDLLPSNFSLTFFLVPTDQKFYDYLVEISLHNPAIDFKAPVPTIEISRTINQYDIGVFLAPHLSTNHMNTLPNKFFEFIQARLMLAITPSLEMEKLVKKFDLGVVFDSFDLEEIAFRLSSLSHLDVMRFKFNADIAAKDLNWEQQNFPLLNYVLTN
jgi:hypothetical protein